MKQYRMMFAGAILLAAACVPVSVFAAEEADSSGEVQFVFDDCDVLDDSQEQALTDELADIYNTYEYDAVILVTEDVGNQDEFDYASEFMEQNMIGYGETGDGMCLLHQPESRNIYIAFQGESKDFFTEEVQDLILDDATEILKEDDQAVFETYEAVLRDLKNCLERVRSNKKIRPMDVSGSGIGGFAFLWLAISFVVMAIPTFIMTMIQKGKMKTAKPQKNANNYAQSDGLKLSREEDIYLRTETTKEKIQKDDDSSSGGNHYTSNDKTSGSGRDY